MSELRINVAFVLLNVNLGTEEEVLARLKEIEGVKEAWQIYGVYDMIAKIEAEDAEKLKGIIHERMRRLDNVRNTLTLIAV